MKKFITATIAALTLTCSNAYGCAIERSDHNYFMFSIFQRECMDPDYLDDINKYWKLYAGEADSPMPDFFKYCEKDIVTAAKRKRDNQMLTYLKWLRLYMNTCENIKQDSWDYPTKQQVAKRKENLIKILNASKMYKGIKMKSLYALLRMRANMVLGYDKANIAFWKSTGEKLPSGFWKKAMKNIYARALNNNGQRMEAFDIYAEQGDMTSIKWVARKYRNLAGIESIYNKNPNSPSLAYLVQDFVNNVQQTVDLNPKTDDDRKWIETVGAKTIYKDEAKKFIEFSNCVITDGKSSTPCLWKSASAMLHYLYGDISKAIAEINEALAMNGSQRMIDNARVIRLLALTNGSKITPDFSKFLVSEFEWIDRKITEERGNRLDFDNHYTNVKERIVFRNLVPLFIKQGNDEIATALCGMMQKYNNNFYKDAAEYLNRAYGNYSDYTCRLDTLTADKTIKYFNFLSTKHTDIFEQYVVSGVYYDKDFFNEMIGTKLIAEGNFAEAEKYLEKVSDSFIEGQRINFYMSQRSYSVERWFNRQKAHDEEGFLYTDFADAYGKFNGNQKLQFCKDMLSLLNKYNITRSGEKKDKLAYRLAVNYYQASCYGDCWYLTHYGKSITDSARINEKDFANEAIKYLNECKLSNDLNIRYKAIYALAFIPVDPWYYTDYDKNYNNIFIPRPNAEQYKYMEALNNFAAKYPELIDNYTSNCDILNRFRITMRH